LIAACRSGTDGATSSYPGVFGTELDKAVAKDVKGSGETLVPRPEHSIFGLAMLGGGKVFGQAHLYGQFAEWLLMTR